jgi:hypothetical protein
MIANYPKLVYSETGELVEVILAAQEYLDYLRLMSEAVDWELLPPHIQDAIDKLLINEVRAERETAVFLPRLTQPRHLLPR